MRDPYTPGSGVVPRTFVGRESDQRRAESQLLHLAASGQPRMVTAYVGSRGVGKTVMLHRVRQTARDHGFVTAHVGFVQDEHVGVQDLVGAIAHAVAPYRDDTAWNRVAPALTERLGQFSVEVGAPGLAKIAARWDAPAAAAPRLRVELRDILVDSARLARAIKGTGLILTLDELQDCPRPELGQIAHALQEATNLEAPLGVYAAGLTHTPEVLAEAASFTERFDYRPFGALNREMSELAVLGPARDVGVTWRPDALDLVVSRSGGSPYLLQLHGSETWLAANPTPAHPEITLEHAQEGIREGRNSLDNGLFRARWHRASTGEKHLLAAIAVNLDPATHSASSRDITATLGTTRAAISAPRQRLIDKGLIEAPAHGALGFTMPGFERFVLAQSGIEDLASPDRGLRGEDA